MAVPRPEMGATDSESVVAKLFMASTARVFDLLHRKLQVSGLQGMYSAGDNQRAGAASRLRANSWKRACLRQTSSVALV